MFLKKKLIGYDFKLNKFCQNRKKNPIRNADFLLKIQ